MSLAKNKGTENGKPDPKKMTKDELLGAYLNPELDGDGKRDERRPLWKELKRRES